jgi:hypothetical protein
MAIEADMRQVFVNSDAVDTLSSRWSLDRAPAQIASWPPRLPAILIPSLILYHVSLIGMWGTLWNLDLLPLAITGVACFATLGVCFCALAKEVG